MESTETKKSGSAASAAAGRALHFVLSGNLAVYGIWYPLFPDLGAGWRVSDRVWVAASSGRTAAEAAWLAEGYDTWVHNGDGDGIHSSGNTDTDAFRS